MTASYIAAIQDTPDEHRSLNDQIILALVAEMDGLVEQLEAAEKTLREIGRTYDGVTPIFRKTGTKLLGADAFTYAPDICEALNQARRWTVSYPAKEPLRDEQFEHDYRMGTTPDE